MLTFSSAIRITISARGAALLLYVLQLSGLLEHPPIGIGEPTALRQTCSCR
jgi:hypothetical protein